MDDNQLHPMEISDESSVYDSIQRADIMNCGGEDQRVSECSESDVSTSSPLHKKAIL